MNKRTNYNLTFQSFFDLAVLAIILGFCSGIASAQTCLPPTYQGNVNSCQGINIKFLNRNAISDIDHFTVRWNTDGLTQTLPASALGASHTGLPCNWSSTVTITQYLKNGASCVTNSTGSAPHTFPCNLCAGSGSGLSVANAASWRDGETEDSIGVLGTDADMTMAIESAVSFLPFSLGGLSVTIADQPAGLFYVSPRQVNFYIPRGVPLGIQSVQVTTADGKLFTGTANIQVETPAIFTETANGQGYYKATWYGNGYMSLWGTGFKSPWVSLLLGDGRQIRASYSGPAPGFYGLWQLNFKVDRPTFALGAIVRSWVNPCYCIEGGGFRDSNGGDLR